MPDHHFQSGDEAPKRIDSDSSAPATSPSFGENNRPPTDIAAAHRRVWPTLLAIPIAIVGYSIAASTAFSIYLLAVAWDGRVHWEEYWNDPFVPEIISIFGQSLLLGIAICGAVLSPVAWRRRLNLRLPTAPWWTLLPLIIATFFVSSLSSWVIEIIFGGMSEQMEYAVEAIRAASIGHLVLLLVTVGLIPGLCEETLFRGYIQTRLQSRWGPLLAIVIASASFGVFHIDPQYAVYAFIMGLWLGVVAWRTRSIIFPIVCHMAVNGAAVLFTTFLPEIDSYELSEASTRDQLTSAAIWLVYLVGTAISIGVVCISWPERTTQSRNVNGLHRRQ